MTRPRLHKSGQLLYYPDMVRFAKGERVRTRDGQTGTVVDVPIVTSPCYIILLDGEEHSVIFPQGVLEPETIC